MRARRVGLLGLHVPAMYFISFGFARRAVWRAFT